MAEKRGRDHAKHQYLQSAISKLIAETGDLEFGRLYSVAETLQANYYENFATEIEVKGYCDDIEMLLHKLEKLI